MSYENVSQEHVTQVCRLPFSLVRFQKPGWSQQTWLQLLRHLVRSSYNNIILLLSASFMILIHCGISLVSNPLTHPLTLSAVISTFSSPVISTLGRDIRFGLCTAPSAGRNTSLASASPDPTPTHTGQRFASTELLGCPNHEATQQHSLSAPTLPDGVKA